MPSAGSSTTELGCLIGLSRDVVQRTGMQVTVIQLEPHNVSNSITSPDGRQTDDPPSSRRLAKFSALVQAFIEFMFCVGYVVRNIDAKFGQPTLPGQLRLSSTGVCFEPPPSSNTQAVLLPLLDVGILEDSCSL